MIERVTVRNGVGDAIDGAIVERESGRVLVDIGGSRPLWFSLDAGGYAEGEETLYLDVKHREAPHV